MGAGAQRQEDGNPPAGTHTVVRGAFLRLGRSSGFRRETRPGALSAGSLPAAAQWLSGRAALTAAGPRGILTRFPILPRAPKNAQAPNLYFLLSYLTGSALSMYPAKVVKNFSFPVEKDKLHKKANRFFPEK